MGEVVMINEHRLACIVEQFIIALREAMREEEAQQLAQLWETCQTRGLSNLHTLRYMMRFMAEIYGELEPGTPIDLPPAPPRPTPIPPVRVKGQGTVVTSEQKLRMQAQQS